jgi:hypothetical protein
LSEFGTCSSTPLSPEQVEQKKQPGRTNYYFRLSQSYVPFFQAMAEDYHRRGKIKAPSISLLAKTCLITAGNAWNRMTLQLMTQDFEKRRQEELERQRQQQQSQNYQQRREFVHTSGDIVPQMDPSIRPPSFVIEETKRRLQQEAGNLVNRPMTEYGHPTFTPRLDMSSMTWKPH